MIFALALTATSGGSSSSPQVTKLKLTRGLIYKVEVDFPPGPAGLVHCYMEYEGAQVYPTSKGQDFYGNGVVISFDDTRWVKTEPFEFDIYYWSNNATFDHTFQIRIGLVSASDLIRRYVPADFFADMQKLSDDVEEKESQKSESTLQKLFNIFKAKG